MPSRVAGMGKIPTLQLGRPSHLAQSGLVAELERKNGWTLAEHAGESGPQGMQRLLRRADWDVDVSVTTCASMSWTAR